MVILALLIIGGLSGSIYSYLNYDNQNNEDNKDNEKIKNFNVSNNGNVIHEEQHEQIEQVIFKKKEDKPITSGQKIIEQKITLNREKIKSNSLVE